MLFRSINSYNAMISALHCVRDVPLGVRIKDFVRSDWTYRQLCSATSAMKIYHDLCHEIGTTNWWPVERDDSLSQPVTRTRIIGEFLQVTARYHWEKKHFDDTPPTEGEHLHLNRTAAAAEDLEDDEEDILGGTSASQMSSPYDLPQYQEEMTAESMQRGELTVEEKQALNDSEQLRHILRMTNGRSAEPSGAAQRMEDLLNGWTESVNIIQVAASKFDNSLRRVTGGLITVVGVNDVDITMVERLPFKKLLALYYKLFNSACFYCPTLLDPTIYAMCYLSKLFQDRKSTRLNSSHT